MFKVYYEYDEDFVQWYSNLQDLINDVVLKHGTDRIVRVFYKDDDGVYHEVEVRN